jgi:hypothetical protein
MKLDALNIFASLLIACLSLQTATAADPATFIPIFNGKTLESWRVIPPDQPTAWSVRDGLLVGSSDGKGSDLIWKDNDLGDFELKLSYRFRTQGNSGIHIRGLLGESSTHRVKGYHVDFGHVGIGPRVLGSWDFHGAARGDYLVARGSRVIIDKEGKKRFIKIEGALTSSDVRRREWNEVHVVVSGHHMYFSINGKRASEVVDNEAAKRIERGVIGLQLHSGPPMTIEFRDILLKRPSKQ